MKRRELFSFLPLPLLAGWFRFQSRPASSPPTMADLIEMAEGQGHIVEYYARVLNDALNLTGPVVADIDGYGVVFHRFSGWPGTSLSTITNYGKTPVRQAQTVPLPGPLLSRIRPADRGPSFPRGIPYEPPR